MSQPEITPQQTGHETFKAKQNTSNLSREKREEQIRLGKALADLDGLEAEDIGQMPEVMMETFLDEKQNK